MSTAPFSSLAQHPQRGLLHNEVHARPPARIRMPALVVYVAVLNTGVSRAAECAHLQRLFDRLLRFNVAGFINQYRDLQGAVTKMGSVRAENITTNVAAAKCTAS